jgi:predicted XRE-type DNA-binding protein
MEWGDARLPERFWSQGKQVAEHWLWTGTTQCGGYGRFTLGGVEYRVHKLVYSLAIKVPEFMVLHHCNIRICFQPNCLYEGTHEDNMEDRRIDRRETRGEASPHAKLTEDNVREIRRLSSETRMSQKEIGALFGVGQSTISHIRQGIVWGHVK